MKIPDRWLNYNKSSRIKGTKFVACKTPLRENFSTKLSPKTSFTPQQLLLTHPKIKLVIDLTQTGKYYDGQKEFEDIGIQYVKIFCPARGIIPNDNQFQLFVNAVNSVLKSNPDDNLVAVHCTHGINRTGYFIVRYMIEEMGLDSRKAIQRFAISRGHEIERKTLVNDLLRRNQNLQGSSAKS